MLQIIRHIWDRVDSGWIGQNDSGNGNLRPLESSLSYPMALEAPVELQAMSGSS